MFQRKNIPLLATFGVLIALLVIASFMFPKFLTPLNFANILRNNAFLGVIAVGMTFVILSGGIDLSVGTMMGFSTILLARLIEVNGISGPVSILLVLAVGAGFGAILGWIIHAYRLPPFLVTLSGMFFAKGMAFVILPSSKTIADTWFREFAGFKIILFSNAPLTSGTILFLVIVIAGIAITRLTRFGRNVYAVGGAESSAVLMGLPVGGTKVAVYAISGFCAALGGILWAMNSTSGDPSVGLGTELDAIACVVIGGTLLTGGVGYIIGTFAGVLVYGTIATIIDFQGNLESSDARIALGLLLLVFIVMQRIVVQGADRSAKG